MTKTTFIAVAVVIVILGGLAWYSQVPGKISAASNNGAAVASALVFTENTYNFGSISMKNGTVSHDFKLKNNGTVSMTIEKIYTSCMCTSAVLVSSSGQVGPFGMLGHGFVPPVNEILLPGEEAILRVTFDPAAHGPAGIGRINRKVTMESSEGRLADINFIATVTP